MPDSSKVKPKDRSKISKRRLTPAEWKKAKAMRAEQGFTIQEIAESFNVSHQAVQSRLAKDGVKQGVTNKEIKNKKELIIANDAQEMLVKGSDITVLALQGVEWLQKRSLKLFTEAVTEGRPLVTIGDDQKVIRTMLNNMKLCHDVSDMIIQNYKQFDEKDVPVLILKSMTKEDEQAVREAGDEVGDLMGDSGTPKTNPESSFDDSVVIIGGENE